MYTKFLVPYKDFQGWGLASPLQDFEILLTEPLISCPGCVFGVIVVLEEQVRNPSSVLLLREEHWLGWCSLNSTYPSSSKHSKRSLHQRISILVSSDLGDLWDHGPALLVLGWYLTFLMIIDTPRGETFAWSPRPRETHSHLESLPFSSNCALDSVSRLKCSYVKADRPLHSLQVWKLAASVLYQILIVHTVTLNWQHNWPKMEGLARLEHEKVVSFLFFFSLLIGLSTRALTQCLIFFLFFLSWAI